MEKVYIVYESNYGELMFEADITEIIGIYKDKQQAKLKVKEEIEKYTTKENNFVLDEDNKDYYKNKDNVVRLFYGEQENWNSYFEIIIEEKEVEE